MEVWTAHLTDGDEVLEALGHLEALDVQVASVEEIVHPLVVIVVRLGLRQLVVVVRELEVAAAGMDVHVGAEDVPRHDGALDVPARPAAAPLFDPGGSVRSYCKWSLHPARG